MLYSASPTVHGSKVGGVAAYSICSARRCGISTLQKVAVRDFSAQVAVRDFFRKISSAKSRNSAPRRHQINQVRVLIVTSRLKIVYFESVKKQDSVKSEIFVLVRLKFCANCRSSSPSRLKFVEDCTSICVKK